MTQPASPAAIPPQAGAVLPQDPVYGPLGGLWHALARLPADKVAFTFVIALASSLLFPFLGAVGLYDPWETHYAEVAREMVARDDFVHPHWKEFYFFSKPVLLFWMSAIGFKVLDLLTGDVTRPGTSMPELTELAARLPVALVSLIAIICVYRVANRFFGRRAAVLSSIVLMTTPFWALVSRQHITDMPFVGFATAGVCIMMEAFFGTEEEAEEPVNKWLVGSLLLVTLPQYLQICRSTQLLENVPPVARYVVFAVLAGLLLAFGWWLMRNGKDSRAHLFYVFTGLATLAKGLPGVLMPGLVFLVYVVCTWEWHRLRRIRVITGAAVFLLVAAPWYVVLSLFTGKDDEGKTFAQRFWIHDHLNRLTGGVHGERGTFEYYIKQLGVGVMPWTGLMPFAWLKMASPEKEESQDETQRAVKLFLALWALTCFGLFSISTTKFHHYILPMVPPLALCTGVYLADLWEKRSTPPVVVVVAMALTAVILGQDLWRNPHLIIDLFTYHYVSYKPDYYFPTTWPFGLAFGIMGGIAAAAIVLGALMSNADAIREALSKKASGALDLPRFLVAEVVEAVLWILGLVGGLFMKPGPSYQGRSFVVGTAVAGLVCGYFYTGVYFLQLAPHWSQRYLFNTYFAQKQGDEPIIAYLMNWRGESFYSKATEPQINDGNQLKTRLKNPGREFILVETTRYKGMESSLSPEFRGKINIVDRSNSKWYLVRVDE